MWKRRESPGASGTSGRGVIGTAFGVVLDSELIQSQEGRPLARLDPVIVGGAVATAAPQQGIDEGLTDKVAVAIG
jgi:hypothetical protein